MSLNCQVCEINPYKYKCPRCSYKTCSLICCKKHKTIIYCTGQRDKAKFLKKDEIDEMELLNDYRYLEETSNIIDASQRPSLNLDSSTPSNSATYNGFFENLRKFVNCEFGITLNLMPNQATRHLANKTRFNRSSKVVSWSIEFIFHLNNKSPNLIKLNSEKNLFSSKETLRTILNSFYEKYKNDLFEPISHKTRVNTDSSISLDLHTEFNHIIEKEDFFGLNILLEVIDFENKQKFYTKLDLNETLENSLRGQTLLEYPTFYIVKDEEMSSYKLKRNIDETKKDLSLNGKNESTANILEDNEFKIEDNDKKYKDTDENTLDKTKRSVDLDHKLTIKKLKTEITEDGELSD